MVHDPEFERKHPRDPADGQFVETPGSAWAARISDAIGSGRPAAVDPPAVQAVTELRELPETPPDGVDLRLDQLGQYGRDVDDEGEVRFLGLEFWDAFNGTWRDGGNTVLEGDELVFENDFGPVTWSGGVTVRHELVSDIETDTNSQEPDPSLEYYNENSDEWIPGEDLTRVKSQYYDGWEWETEDGDILAGEVLGRPIIHPTDFDSKPLDPDHPGARQIRALDLVDLRNRGYLLGGYQILGPDGQWHTIEEAYQDDPDQEVMELIADGLHLPGLDTSEELVIRRTPWGE